MPRGITDVRSWAFFSDCTHCTDRTSSHFPAHRTLAHRPIFANRIASRKRGAFLNRTREVHAPDREVQSSHGVHATWEWTADSLFLSSLQRSRWVLCGDCFPAHHGPTLFPQRLTAPHPPPGHRRRFPPPRIRRSAQPAKRSPLPMPIRPFHRRS